MPTFDTPGPISVSLDLTVGTARIMAGKRLDATVEVRPTRESRRADVRVAKRTRVEYTDGRLLVLAPSLLRSVGLFRVGSIDVTVTVPEGSRVRGKASAAAFHSKGRLGECRIRTSSGEIRLGHVGALDLNASSGDIVIHRC